MTPRSTHGVNVVVLASTTALLIAAARSNNTDCHAWRPNTAQNVTVSADAGTLYWGPECNAILQNINLTVFCYPNTTIHIAEWDMRGGYIAIVGAPEAPWSISDVAVAITLSTISAEGPAIGVMLGFGWLDMATATSWVASNVTLVSSASTLHSASNGGSAVGSALGVTVGTSSAASSINVELHNVSLFAQRSNLTAVGTAAAIVGVAMPSMGGPIIVSQCSFVLVISTALATCAASTSHDCASAVGGLSLGQASNVAIFATGHYVAWSNASSNSNGNSYRASTVGGVSVAYSKTFMVSNSTHYVAWSNASSSSSTDSYSASSVGGVSVAFANDAFTVGNSTQYVAWSNASSTSSSSNSFSASTLGAITLAFSFSAFTVSNSIQYISWCNASSSSFSSGYSNAYGASSVGGVSVAYAYASFVVSNSIQYMESSNAKSSSSVSFSSSGSKCFSTSSAGGVALSFANAAFSVATCSQAVAWSNVSSSSSSSDSNSYSASTAGGVCAPQGTAVSSTDQFTTSSVQACAYGELSHRAFCGNVTATSNCCALNVPVAADDVKPPPLTLRIPSVPVVGVPEASSAKVIHNITASCSQASSTTSTLSRLSATRSSRQLRVTTRREEVSMLRASRTRRHSPSMSPPLAVVTAAPAPEKRGATGVDGTAARAVVAAGYGSSAVVATISPTSANKPSVVSRAVQTATCTVLDGDVSTFPTPDAWSLLPSFMDADATSTSAGMLLSTLVVVAASLAWSLVMT